MRVKKLRETVADFGEGGRGGGQPHYALVWLVENQILSPW